MSILIINIIIIIIIITSLEMTGEKSGENGEGGAKAGMHSGTTEPPCQITTACCLPINTEGAVSALSPPSLLPSSQVGKE